MKTGLCEHGDIKMFVFLMRSVVHQSVVVNGGVAIGKPEREVRKASHCCSKQQ